MKAAPEMSRDGSMLRRDVFKALAASGAFMLPAWCEVALADNQPVTANGEDAAWKQLVALLEAAAQRWMSLTPRPDDPALRAKLYEHTLQVLVCGYLGVFSSDVNSPDWFPIWNNALPTAAPNPDTAYFSSTIDGKGVYLISGYRGSTRFADLQWGQGVRGKNYPGPRIDSVSLDALERDADGYFELILSAERPDGHRGNWRYLDPATAGVTLRSVARDWNKELDPRLCIERLNVPPRQSSQHRESTAAKLIRLTRFIDGWTRMFIGEVPSRSHRRAINQLMETPRSNIGRLEKQFYFSGSFDIAPGEALLIESDVLRKSTYWNIQLNDELFMSYNYGDVQCSLNDFQAKPDNDGKLRAVISLEDPGVPNWSIQQVNGVD